MQNSVLLYIILALAAAAFIAGFQYLYKNKGRSRDTYLLAFLRFLTISGLLLLLINPKFKKQILTTIKPNLVVLVDNTKSIKKDADKKQVQDFLNDLKNDPALKDKFSLKEYGFSNDINVDDSIDFNKNHTNIYRSLKSVEKLYNRQESPVILLTDGNQTQGLNYTNIQLKHEVFPVVVGDTTQYQDIKITQLNVNKYAYLNHKFPVEAFVVYQGKENVNATFTVKAGNQTVFTKKVVLDGTKNSENVSFYLPANQIGVQNYRANISYLKNEKNSINNNANFSVEVINEQAKIAIISSILHPDIGMLKRAIESNKQRKVEIKNPKEKLNSNDYKTVILYQPDQTFKKVFDDIKQSKKNFLLFTGTKTNWNFLNNNQSYFKKQAITSTENYVANYNPSFSTFLVDDLGFSNFAPLQDYFGDVTFSVPYESLLFQQIGSYASEKPLVAAFEQDDIRGVAFFGENSWRWRMSSYTEERSFQNYDEFINKMVQYLSLAKKTDFLEIENEPYYYANDNIKVKAYYYDANYKFNEKIKLWITVTNRSTKKQLKYPFALNYNVFEVNLSSLEPGDYYFTVSDENNKQSKRGSFSILNFDVEQKHIGANKSGLQELSNNTQGNLFYLDQLGALKDQLIKDEKYVSVQKSKEKITPLIDWKWLLGIIALSLSLEWFIRKYKGLV